MAASKINSINTTIPPNDPISDPDARWQKLLNCWQTGSQFAELLPLWAKYTIDVAVDAPAVKRANITFKTMLFCNFNIKKKNTSTFMTFKTRVIYRISYRVKNYQKNSTASCRTPHDVNDGQRNCEDKIGTYYCIHNHKQPIL